jgi:hypothetical protein
MIEERAQSVGPIAGRYCSLGKNIATDRVAQVQSLMRTTDHRRLVSVHQLNAADLDRDDVIRWLSSLRLPIGSVDIIWVGVREGLVMALDDFIPHFDDLWLAGADDVWICDASVEWVLELDHEERMTWWERMRQKG